MQNFTWPNGTFENQVSLSSLRTFYSFISNEGCTEGYLAGINPFQIPPSSIFKGTQTVNHVKCKWWKYVFNGDRLNLVSEYWVSEINGIPQPIRITYSGDQPYTVVDFTEWTVGTPSKEIFQIPEWWNCQTEKVNLPPSRPLFVPKTMAPSSE